MNLLQYSSLSLLLPSFQALYNVISGGPHRLLHVFVVALVVSSLANHSRPHDGPVFDFIDYLDKAVIMCTLLAAGGDALLYNRGIWILLICAFTTVGVAAAYAYAWTARESKTSRPSGESVHVLVHALGAITLWLLLL
jgi:hypothetical protein